MKITQQELRKIIKESLQEMADSRELPFMLTLAEAQALRTFLGLLRNQSQGTIKAHGVELDNLMQKLKQFIKQ